MKLKKSDINLLIMLAGVLIAVLAYNFVFVKYNEKTDMLNAENASLQQQVDYLQDLADHKQEYIDKTESMQAEIDEIKAQFPAEYKPEDDILYIRGIEMNHDTFAPSLGMGAPGAIEVAAPEAVAPVVASDEDSIDGEEVAAAPAPAAEAAVPATSAVLYRVALATSLTADYETMKNIIKDINEDPNRKSLDSISMAFDSETGDITAAINMSAYSLSGTEKVYSEPSVPGINFGTGNIFNSAEKKKAVEAMKEAEKKAEESEEE